MFYMEYNNESIKGGSDAGKNYDDYMKKGGAVSYSDNVETKYREWKKILQHSPDKAKAAKSLDNPYPLPNK